MRGWNVHKNSPPKSGELYASLDIYRNCCPGRQRWRYCGQPCNETDGGCASIHARRHLQSFGPRVSNGLDLDRDLLDGCSLFLFVGSALMGGCECRYSCYGAELCDGRGRREVSAPRRSEACSLGGSSAGVPWCSAHLDELIEC